MSKRQRRQGVGNGEGVSPIKYLIRMYNILWLLLHSNLTQIIASLTVLIRFNDNSEVAYCLDNPVI